MRECLSQVSARWELSDAIFLMKLRNEIESRKITSRVESVVNVGFPDRLLTRPTTSFRVRVCSERVDAS